MSDGLERLLADDAAGEPQPIPVLLVEDSASARILTAALLRRIGCTVESAADGEGALKQLDDFPARIVFLDIDLPGIDGVETAKRIRQMPAPACNALIVALTGYVDGAIPGAPQGLFDQSIAKPATRERLALAIAAACEPSVRTVGAAVALPNDQLQILVAIAVREMRLISARLASASEASDVEAVRQAAHQLQGIAATFGSPEVAQLAAQLESEARQHAALDLSRELTALCTVVLEAAVAAMRKGAPAQRKDQRA
jgi:CheY-like chemotaxis protein